MAQLEEVEIDPEDIASEGFKTFEKEGVNYIYDPDEFEDEEEEIEDIFRPRRRTRKKKRRRRSPAKRIYRYLRPKARAIRRRLPAWQKMVKGAIAPLGFITGLFAWHFSLGGLTFWEVKRGITSLLDFKFPSIDTIMWRLTDPASDFSAITWGTLLTTFVTFGARYLPWSRGIRKYLNWMTIFFGAVFVGHLVNLFTEASEEEYGAQKPPSGLSAYGGSAFNGVYD